MKQPFRCGASARFCALILLFLAPGNIYAQTLTKAQTAATITATIKANGKQQITGPILQSNLLDLLDVSASWQGAWSSTVQYSYGEIVTYSGSFWIANSPVTGTAPGTTSGQWSVLPPGTLPSADIFVGNSSNVASPVPMSGDCSLDNTGAITCTIPSPQSNLLGGVFLSSAPTNEFATGVNSFGQITYAQPSAAQISGLGTFATQNYASPPAIGGTTPNIGNFTTLSAAAAGSLSAPTFVLPNCGTNCGLYAPAAGEYGLSILGSLIEDYGISNAGVITFDVPLNFGNHAIVNISSLTSNNGAGYELIGGTSIGSSVILPDRAQPNAGLGAFAAGDVSIYANVSSVQKELARFDTSGNVTFPNITTAGVATLTSAGLLGSEAQITAAQAPVFTSSANGFVPASGGGTTNFLRADGTFAAPSGGSGNVVGTGTSVVGDLMEATNTTATGIQDSGYAPSAFTLVTQPATHTFWNPGAAIDRYNDRVFMGGATANNGTSGTFTGTDWLCALTTASYAGGPGVHQCGTSSQVYVLTDSTLAQAANGFLSGSQTLNVTSAAQTNYAASFVMVNNNTTLGTNAATSWGLYLESHRVGSAAGETTGIEIETRNSEASPATVQDSINYSEPGMVNDLQLGCGAGLSTTGQNNCDAAELIFANTIPFKAGIIFANGSITANSNLGGLYPAVEMSQNQALIWLSAAQTRSGIITSDASGNLQIYTKSGGHLFVNGTQVYCGSGGTTAC